MQASENTYLLGTLVNRGKKEGRSWYALVLEPGRLTVRRSRRWVFSSHDKLHQQQRCP
jgi:hypothetical protein